MTQSQEDTEYVANMLATYGIATQEATVAMNSVPLEDDRLRPLSSFHQFVPEEENDDVLILGRWLERGGSAFIVSTAGTGKSIHSMQTALSWTCGIPFAGLRPRKKLNVWVFQSEDSPTRVTIDREDIIAEMSENRPDIDWRTACARIMFVKLSGKVGAAWLSDLDDLLTSAELRGTRPDVIIINPLLAFIGGPITDGQYVTPFLRGGEINRVQTCGLQDILERHRIGALIYHHTPKPPTEKEVDSWLKSSFPEYQGAGSSDITNWGRSFITMMRVPKHPRMVMLTAGKNGGGLGWEEADSARRMYLHWSDGESIDTGARHAWRECTQDEIAEAQTGTQKPSCEEAVDLAISHIVEKVTGTAMPVVEVKKNWKAAGVSARAFEEGLKKLKTDPSKYGISVEHVQSGRQGWDIIGTPVEVSQMVFQIKSRYASDDHITPHHTASRDAVDRITRAGREYIYTLPLRDTVVTGSKTGDRITDDANDGQLAPEPLF